MAGAQRRSARREGRTPIRTQADARVRGLLGVAHAVAQLDDAQDILRLVSQSVVETLGCDRSAIVLLTENGSVSLAAAHGQSPEVLDVYRAAGFRETIEPLRRWLERERRTLVVNGPPFPDVIHPWLVEALRIRAQLVAPLIAEGRVVGGLTAAYSGRDAGFAPEDVDFVEGLASQAVVALRRASLVAALRASEKRYRTLVEHAGDVIFTLGLDGTFTFVSRRARDLVGYGPEELLGRHFSTILPPQSLEAAMRRFQDELAGTAPDDAPVYEVLCKDGSIVPLELSTASITDEQGRVAELLGVARDISERRRAEEQVRQTYETLRALVQASPVAIVALDPSGNVTMWNEAAERTFGWSAEEVVGRPYPVVPEGRREEHLALVRRTLQGQSITDVEVRRRRRDGTAIRLSLSAGPTYDAGGNVSGIMSVLVDITERNRANRVIRQQSRALARSLAAERALTRQLVTAQEEERRRLAYDLHDGLIQMLVAGDMHLEAFRSTVRAHNLEAGHELDRAAQRIKSAIREGRRVISELRPSTLDDFGLVEAVRRLLRDLAAQEGWEWDLDVDLGAWNAEPSMETSVFRIVQEALTNVRKHADTRKVAVRMAAQGGVLRVEVQDWGKGFNVATALAEARAAHRLGLAGITDRARLLDGRSEVASAPGQGTCVKVEVPIGRPPPPAWTEEA
jgi:PAS domain S-box-containing protein